MEDFNNFSPTELQLKSENEKLKKRLKEMEELYSEEEEKSYQKIQSLMQEKKEMKEKIETLQNRINNFESFSSSPSKTCSSSPLSKNKHDSILYQSLSKDYEILLENFHAVCDEKLELEEKIDKMNKQIKKLEKVVERNLDEKEMYEIIEKLQIENSAKEEMIQKLNTLNSEMCQINQPQITLFDELEEIKQKELQENGEESESELTEMNNIENNEPSKIAKEEIKEEINHQTTLSLPHKNFGLSMFEKYISTYGFQMRKLDFAEASKIMFAIQKSFTNIETSRFFNSDFQIIIPTKMLAKYFDDNVEQSDISSTFSFPTVIHFENETNNMFDIIAFAQSRRIDSQRCDSSMIKDLSNKFQNGFISVSNSKFRGTLFSTLD
uniref:Uncharacterized protein n=1 Tax=Panagrolaimus davidi TaxID=227884 RepID=A0A914Q9B1_9BILA